MEIVAVLLLFGAVKGFTTDPDLPAPPDGANFVINRIPMSANVQPMSELVVTDHVVNLKRGNSKSLSSIYVQAMRKQLLSPTEEDSRLTVRIIPASNK